MILSGILWRLYLQSGIIMIYGPRPFQWQIQPLWDHKVVDALDRWLMGMNSVDLGYPLGARSLFITWFNFNTNTDK